MTRTLSLVCALPLALALAACGDDPGYGAKQNPPTGGPLRPTAGPLPGTPPASATPSAKQQLSAERFAELSKTEVPGFTRTSERSSKSNATMTYEGKDPNAQGWHPSATVLVEHCVFCSKMDLAEWRANPNLKKLLSSAHAENPALVFQVDEIDLGGRKGIAIYKESFVETKNESGTSRSTAYGLQVWWNDGTHQVMIEVSPRGKPMAGSLEELRASLSRAEMEAAARALFAPLAPGL